MNDGPSILFQPLEFPNWELGKPQSYTAHFGLEEGMLANGARPFVVPAIPPSPAGGDLWRHRTPMLSAGRRFDQAWLGLVHARYEPDFCAWLKSEVPVRVGLLFESMSYTAEEIAELPPLSGRKAHVLRQADNLGLTHVLCADEMDTAPLEAAGIRAIWFPSAIPERFVARAWSAPRFNRAAFFGNLYSEERKRLTLLPGVQGLLSCPSGPEAGTDLPAAFDALHAWMVQALEQALEPPEKVHRLYVQCLRSLRQAIFETWMGGLPDWNGLVNLPSYFKGYAGRVIEAMAANVPVVSWDIPERPRTRALFEDSREILLFRRDDPDQLAAHLIRLGRDPSFGRRILEAARAKVLAHHTSKIRVRQMFDWIAMGTQADYGD